MAAARLSYLDICILCWIDAEIRRSNGMLAASCHKLMQGLSIGEKHTIRHSLASLETKGVIVVGCAPGGKPAYLSLTAEGRHCLAQVPGFCHG